MSVLREPAFRSFFAAHTVSQLGDRVSEIAFPLIAVLVLDASAGEVSVLTALIWLPNLGSILLGAWIDGQPHKRRILVAADLVRALLLVTLPIAFAADALSLAQLYLVALLTGAAAAVFNVTYPAFFVQLVPRSEYLSANSALSGSRSASYVAGPALGGGLVQWLSAPVALVVDVVSFLASALLLSRVRPPLPPPTPAAPDPGAPETGTARRLLHDAGAGLRFTLAHPVLRGVLGCCTTANYFTFIGASALVIVYASRELHLSSGLIGLSLGLGAVGGLAGAATAPWMSRHAGLGRTVVLGGIIFPASIAVVTLAAGPVWVRAAVLAASELVAAVGVMWFDVTLNSVMATVIPHEVRARVSGAFSAVNYGVRPVGALTGGVLSATIGLQATLWVAAVGGVSCVLWLAGNPVLRARTLDDLAPADADAGRAPLSPAAAARRRRTPTPGAARRRR